MLFLFYFFGDKFIISRQMVFFIFIHELCHLACFFLLKTPIKEIALNPFGISAIYPFSLSQSYGKDIFCYLSAPVLNILLSQMFKTFFPQSFFVRTAVVINFLIGGFNLLPIVPLDGGRALSSFFFLKMDFQKARKWTMIVSLLFLVPLFLFSIFVFLRTKNFSLILTWIFLFGSFFREC